MPKNKVSEYSSTASNNTDIGGINIAEGCAPSGINNAIRELMAQLKDMQSGTDGDGFTVGGAFTCSGAAVFSSTVALGGSATATTQSAGDNTTKVATTAYVKTAVDNAAGFTDPGANGVVVRTALNTSTARTITAGTGISDVLHFIDCVPNFILVHCCAESASPEAPRHALVVSHTREFGEDDYQEQRNHLFRDGCGYSIKFLRNDFGENDR